MGITCHSKHVAMHEGCVKAGSCFREDAGKAALVVVHGAANLCRTDSKPGSPPPTLHNLQAALSAKQTGIGWAVPQGARSQVKKSCLRIFGHGYEWISARVQS